jgi:hypothetical protein
MEGGPTVNFDIKRRRVKELGLSEDWDKDAFGEICTLNLLYCPEKRAAANQRLIRTAKWFYLPHPTIPGRDLRGEPDFAAIRLIRALYLCGGLMEPETRKAVRGFFTKEDFESKYKSENHILLFRVSRHLAAQAFETEYFENYGKRGADIAEEDARFIADYLKFRAKRGWAEFDSLGYAAEIVICLLTLYDFSKSLKALSEMSLNLLLLDMIADSMGPLYCGAHGRIYGPAALDYKNSGMYEIYNYYFVEGAEINKVLFAEATSDFVPASYVYEVLRSKPPVYENREAKHLHSITMEPPQQFLPQVEGNINKYTYITPDYALGAVNWQDHYPEGSDAAWYSHHQQHEWELTLSGGTDIRIFTHHPGSFGLEGKEHGYWTGDLGCLCGQVFCDKNILLATYDIPENESRFIHANFPLKYFEVVYGGNYLFLKRENVYAALWFSNGYRVVAEGEYANREIISEGGRHGFVCVVGTAENGGSFEGFINSVKNTEIMYDGDKRTIEYGRLMMSETERFINREKVKFPYNTYDSPFLYGEYGSGIVRVNAGGKETVLDFNTVLPEKP